MGAAATSAPDWARPRDIVVIGASAGGVRALQRLFANLPADLPAALFVVLHVSDGIASRLDAVLGRCSALPVLTAREGHEIKPGRVLVAPSGRHLLLRGPGVQVRREPPEHNLRPSADALFRSAAMTHGPRVAGIVLTGLLDDGALGAREVLTHGGVAIAEDPRTAEYPSMPRHAIQSAPDTVAVELPRLADVLVQVVHGCPVTTERRR